MSELDNAMIEKMAVIVLTEHRPFSYMDFAFFSVGDKQYTMSHGTFRNKIYLLVAKGEVEVDYRSYWTFYTLKGHKFGRPVTTSHVGASSTKSNWLYTELNNLPVGNNALHDIRLSFKVPGAWSILSTNSHFSINSHSKDVRLPGINAEELFIGIVIHRSDTVSVNVACSYTPIAIDIADIIRLSSGLTRVEERLIRYIEDSEALLGSNNGRIKIPPHMKWIVKMWHFGADELMEYSGKKFEMTYADAEGTLSRFYSKQMKDGKTRRRLERQEYPNKELDRAIEDKLNANSLGNSLSRITGEGGSQF